MTPAAGAVLLAVAWGLWHWRAELLPVPYLDDSSVHEQMVRFAAARLHAGHSPYTSWFPYLGLGSPQFLHYQGLGATVAGALGVGTGGDTAFRWLLYLLLSLWPLCVYLSARLLSLGRAAAAAAAVASPFLASVPGVGYEPKAYLWIGWGVWTQLLASWTLPFAWAFAWRALSSRRAVAPAVAFTALTVALHFETGYLALGGVALVGLVGAGRLAPRLGRTALVLAGSLACAAWALVPLVVSSPWAARNQILRGTPLENGYGARQVLTWLVTGRLYDAGRLPVVTVLVAIGLVVTLRRWRHDPAARVVTTLWAACLVLSFGRTTFGSLTVLVPGGGDVFFRRFGMGAQLAGLYLAGIGAVACGRAVSAWARVVLARAVLRRRLFRWSLAEIGAVAVVAVAGLVPLLWQMDAYAAQNDQAIRSQRVFGRLAEADIAPVVSYVRIHGGGRVYAGMPSNWGASFTVGSVPVFKYLEAVDVDEVGYTLRTASLMTDPEYHFDETNPGDFALFGIRYLVLPPGRPPPVPARSVLVRRACVLYEIPADGYVRVVDTVAALAADRTNIGSRSAPYLRSPLPGQARYLTVEWAGAPAATPTAASRGVGLPSGPPGTVQSTRSELADGRMRATVVVRRRAVVALSASYDPGWAVTVDGRRGRPEMLAPAVVGVAVGPGRHVVEFSYRGYAGYPLLAGLALLALVALAAVGRRGPSVTDPAPPTIGAGGGPHQG